MGCSYDTGQCTGYVAMVRYPQVGRDYACLGNACQWWEAAAANGWQRSSTPTEGAVPVWDCTLPGSQGFGHVAVVEQVYPDGTFMVSERNWTGYDITDQRKVTDRAHLLGFIRVPGAPYAGGAVQGAQDLQAAPATGARGLACLYAWKTPSWKIGPWDVGQQTVCFDGLVGSVAWFAGLSLIAVALVLAARRPVGAALEGAGAATGQPELVAAGAVARSGSPQRMGRETTRAARTTRRPQPVAVGAQQAGAVEPRQARVRAPERARAVRQPSSDRLSVQEQETYRALRGLGYTSVQSRRGARHAGSQGAQPERVRRALQNLGS